MPLTLFLTMSILALDFLVYFLFQWTYGDRRKSLSKKIAASRATLSSSQQPSPKPFLVSSDYLRSTNNPPIRPVNPPSQSRSRVA